jgi:acetyl esterase/lipase
MRFLTIDYRLAPEHPHPAAVEDGVAAYRFLLDEGAPPSRLAMAGDSAGGGLTIATLLVAREADLPMPLAAVVLSPWLDLEGTGESRTTRAQADPILTNAFLEEMAEYYLQGQDARAPLASPIYADLRGLPPILIQVGDTEILLSDSTTFARRADESHVDVTLEVWPEMIHVWHLFGALAPEGHEAAARVDNVSTREASQHQGVRNGTSFHCAQ